MKVLKNNFCKIVTCNYCNSELQLESDDIKVRNVETVEENPILYYYCAVCKQKNFL